MTNILPRAHQYVRIRVIWPFLPVMFICVFRWFQLHFDSLLILVMICVLNVCNNLFLWYQGMHFISKGKPTEPRTVYQLILMLYKTYHEVLRREIPLEDKSLKITQNILACRYRCHQCLYIRKRQSVWYTMDGYLRTVHMPSDMCLWQRLQHLWRLILYTMLNPRNKWSI